MELKEAAKEWRWDKDFALQLLGDKDFIRVQKRLGDANRYAMTAAMPLHCGHALKCATEELRRDKWTKWMCTAWDRELVMQHRGSEGIGCL
eukprot:4836766-Amphidinium_carterae.1